MIEIQRDNGREFRDGMNVVAESGSFEKDLGFIRSEF